MAATAVVLDLDGTVWDSFDFYVKVISGHSGEEIEVIHSELNTSPVATVLRRYGVTKATFAKLVDANTSDLWLFDGVPETLLWLASHGSPLGVVTSLPGWIAQPMLEITGLRDCFGVIIDATAGRKPSPNLLHLAISELEADGNAIYVGDTPTDAEMALRAECRFYWVAYGRNTASEAPANAERLLLRFGDLVPP